MWFIASVLILLLSYPSSVLGATYLTETFDGAGWNDWCQYEYPPDPWADDAGATGSEDERSYAGETHCETQVAAPGRGGSGSSLKLYRYGSLWPGDDGLTIRPSGLGSPTTGVLYVRWYMRVPETWTSYGIDNQKMFRLNISGGNEMYVNLYGYESDGSSHIRFAPNATGDDSFAADLVSAASYRDGEWHCHEFMFNIATRTVSYWLDGVQTYNKSPIDMGGIPTNATFGDGSNFMQHFPFGNRTTGSSYPASWQYIEIDDLVIANEYIGTGGGGGDTTAPSISITTSDPQTIYSDSLSVTGTASDAVGVSSCKYRVGYAPNEDYGTACTGTTSWSCSTSGYTGGTNTLYVGCTDAAGNWGSNSITVTYPNQSVTTLLSEDFDDTDYDSRGWYDYSSPVIDTSIYHSGTGSLRSTWNLGSAGPTGVIRRHGLTASDAVYVSFYIRFGYGWQGFGANMPHMVYLLTTENDAYSSLAWTQTTGYIEINGSASSVHVPALKLQDSENIDVNHIDEDRCAYESRAVNGCNGDCDGSGSTSCYELGGDYYNGRVFNGTNQSIDTGWHKVEAYFKMNTISDSVGQSDGIIQMWYDGVSVLNYTDVILRTNDNSSMQFNQIVIAPYGSASPITQSMWIDDLLVADGIPSADITAPIVTISTTDPSSILSDLLSVAGTALDTVGVSSCKYRIGSAPDADNGTACTGTTSWSCSASGFSRGANTLYVGCGDAAGNWGSDSMIVNYPSIIQGVKGLGISHK